MSARFIFFLLIFATMAYANLHAQPADIVYVHPVPGSQHVPVGSTILLKLGATLQAHVDLSSVSFEVIGEKSGLHPGGVGISDNTIVFKPASNFDVSETVHVSVRSSPIGRRDPYSFSFETASIRDFDPAVFQSVSDDRAQARLEKTDAAFPVVGKPTSINGVMVPSDFPQFTVSVSNPTAPGKIFIGNWGGTSYMMILENDGTPYFYRRFSGSTQTRDFKVQPTGTLTRRVYENLNCFVEMDSQYVNIDTLRCMNGYGTDEHDIQLLPNHHSVLIALDYRTVDMSKIVSGGQTNATVIGNHVQELDEHHNVVFEWNCWNNFNIADAVHENLQANTIDYVHMNSIAIDYDGNIVISSRHLSEVTKINRTTGEIMWRLGGLHNQFTFVNDPFGISYQHDVRPVPGKPNQYTIFDNGNFHSPSFTRAVEFSIDTALMTATKVWEYRHTPEYYSPWMGNVQRLPNGNTFIDWADNPLPKAYEVTPSGENVYSATFAQGTPCYRAYRFDWESVVRVPYLVAESYPDKVTLIFNKFGDKNVDKYFIYGGLTPNPVTLLDSTISTSIDMTNLINNYRYYFRVTARNIDGTGSPFSNEENVLVRFTVPGQNMILNGDFSNGSSNWTFNARNGAQAQGSVVNGEYCVTVTNSGTAYSDIQLIQESFPMIQGRTYVFEFDARAASNRILEPRVAQNGGSFIVYSRTGPIVVTPQTQHYRYQFQMTDPTDYVARVVMNCGTSNSTCYIDNVSVKESVPSTIGDKGPDIPKDFVLYANYPNPFNPSTVIRYALPEPGQVTLEVFDLVGQRVANVVDVQQDAGSHQMKFNGANLASGVYLYRVEFKPRDGSTSQVSINKMILLK
jgi:hypothetical protein